MKKNKKTKNKKPQSQRSQCGLLARFKQPINTDERVTQLLETLPKRHPDGSDS